MCVLLRMSRQRHRVTPYRLPRPVSLGVAACVLPLLLMACTSTLSEPDGRPQSTPPGLRTDADGVLNLPWTLDGPEPTGTGNSLYNTEWVLQYKQIDDHMSWSDEFTWGLTMIFRHDDSVYIRTECADYKGRTATPATRITDIQRVAERTCPDEAEDSDRSRLLDMGKPFTFTQEKGLLYLEMDPGVGGSFYGYFFRPKFVKQQGE